MSTSIRIPAVLLAALLTTLFLAILPVGAAEEPVRIVFLVHGWNGSVESFGGLPELLRKGQDGLWPEGYWTCEPIEFKAKNPDATIVEQTRECARKIVEAAQRIRAAHPGRAREVSFVTHSMGGLIVRQLYLDSHGRSDELGSILGDTKRIVCVAPPNQGSDEVRFAIYQLETGFKGLLGDLLSDRALKSLTNNALKKFMADMPLEQAYNMASGSDYIEELNVRWLESGANQSAPLWVLGGAHDMVVDLANANLNFLQVAPDADGRTRCRRLAIDPKRVRFYPYNHSNTNRKDGILGSVETADHPVFVDLAKILMGRDLPPAEPHAGASKIFLRLLHPANDRITGVIVDPFEGAIQAAHSYEANLSAGKVIGFRQKDFVILGGSPRNLMPVAGSTVLILKVKGERRSILPTFLPYLPQVFKFERDYGPQDLIRGRNITYRPLQISIPQGSVTTNSVLSLTVQLSEAAADVPEATGFLPGGCPDRSGSPETRAGHARDDLQGKDTLDLARALRKLGASQDPALVPVLSAYVTDDRFPVPLKRAAVAALGDLRTEKALEGVRSALSSTEPTLKAVAIDALGRVPSVEAVRQLVDLAAAAGDRREERAAVAGLSQAPEPILRKALAQALREDPDTGRRARLTSLALCSGRATPGLIALVAQQALVVLDGKAAKDPYSRILDSLVEHATPGLRTWIRRLCREARQPRDQTWTKALLAKVAQHPDREE